MDEKRKGYICIAFLVIVIFLTIYSMSKSVSKEEKIDIIDYVPLKFFKKFCLDKGYEHTTVEISLDYCFILCSIEKDGWSKSDCFSKEEFKEWLNEL